MVNAFRSEGESETDLDLLWKIELLNIVINATGFKGFLKVFMKARVRVPNL